MRSVLAATALVLFTIAGPAAQSNLAKAERFTAFAIDTSNVAPTARTSQVDLVINRYSTDTERYGLLAVFRGKGQNGLLKDLQKLPVVGYINTPGSLRYDLHFARERAEPDGGRMIFLMTDRYIGAWEANNRPRTIDYPFMLIQLHLDKNGQGEGKASIYTKITEAKDGTIELENFADQPVQLNEIKKVQ